MFPPARQHATAAAEGSEPGNAAPKGGAGGGLCEAAGALDVAAELRKCVRVVPHLRRAGEGGEGGGAGGEEAAAELESGGCFLAVFEKIAHRDAAAADWHSRAAAAEFGVPPFARALLPAARAPGDEQRFGCYLGPAPEQNADAHLAAVIAFFGLRVQGLGARPASDLAAGQPERAPRAHVQVGVGQLAWDVKAKLDPAHMEHGDFSERARALVVLSSGACRVVLQAQPPLARAPGVHVAAAGVKLLEPLPKGFLSKSACRWRPSAEGALLFAAIATRRVCIVRFGALPPAAAGAGVAEVAPAERALGRLLQTRVLGLPVLGLHGVQLTLGDFDDFIASALSLGADDSEAAARLAREVGGLLVTIRSELGEQHVPCVLSHVELRVMLDPGASMLVLERACGSNAAARRVLAAGLLSDP